MICNNCGRVFYEPATAYQYHMEIDDNRYRAYPICPYCESEEIEESDTCAVCGNDKQRTADYCNECQASIHEDVSRFIQELCSRFLIDSDTVVEWIMYDIEGRI